MYNSTDNPVNYYNVSMLTYDATFQPHETFMTWKNLMDTLLIFMFLLIIWYLMNLVIIFSLTPAFTNNKIIFFPYPILLVWCVDSHQNLRKFNLY